MNKLNSSKHELQREIRFVVTFWLCDTPFRTLLSSTYISSKVQLMVRSDSSALTTITLNNNNNNNKDLCAASFHELQTDLAEKLLQGARGRGGGGI